MHAKFESPHAELQALLPWFAVLAGRRAARPAFRTIGEALTFKQTNSVEGVIQPIWGIKRGRWVHADGANELNQR